ncbi:MAG: formyltransferase family protein [Armatimonadota bacterium]
MRSLIRDHNVVAIFAESRITYRGRSALKYTLNRIRERGLSGVWNRIWRTVAQRYVYQECVEVVAAEHPEIPYHSVQQMNDPEVVERIRSFAPDILVVGATRLLDAEVLSIPRLGAINIHGSMLPRNAGLEPTFWALYNEEFDAIGETVHLVVPEMDAGPIVLQEPVPFTLGETVEEIDDRIIRRGADMASEAVTLLATGQAETRALDVNRRTCNGRPTLKQRRELSSKIAAWRATWGSAKPEPRVWDAEDVDRCQTASQ